MILLFHLIRAYYYFPKVPSLGLSGALSDGVPPAQVSHSVPVHEDTGVYFLHGPRRDWTD